MLLFSSLAFVVVRRCRWLLLFFGVVVRCGSSSFVVCGCLWLCVVVCLLLCVRRRRSSLLFVRCRCLFVYSSSFIVSEWCRLLLVVVVVCCGLLL